MRGVILGLLAAAVCGAPAQAAPRFSEIKLSTGVRLHYAEEGPASGSPVIMLHGLSDSWFSFSKVMPLLGKRHRVYALDLRGHGNSDKPATGYLMRDLAEDVVAFMDAQKIARATIVGHSMGSFVAQQVALAAPQRVSRLVLIGSATTPNEFGGMQEFYDAAAALPEPVPEAFARDFQVSTIYRPVGDAFLERAIDESLKLPSRVWRELVKGMSATEAAVALGRLRIPTLVLAGEKDTFAVPALQPPLVAMLKSAKLKIYQETGHAVHWERPAEFARDVDLFMNGRP
jgi:non-heme chloroperoxidase